MVHITNGDSVGEELKRWAGDPRLIVWRDALHEGPVRAGLSFRERSAERTRWWQSERFQPADPFAARDRHVSHLAARDSVWLWFEDDLYDQLQLIEVLHHLVTEGLTQSPHFLIPIPRGIAVDQMAGLAAAKQKVTPQMFAAAESAWTAFTSADPDAVPAIVSSPSLQALPDLAPAFRRLLEHRPSPPDGLNRTEKAVLQVLQDRGSTSANLFVATQKLEERPFLGDDVFFWYLMRMAPLVERDAQGTWFAHPGRAKAPHPRWVGGVLLE